MKALLEPIKEIARFDELFRDLKKGTAGVTVISGCLERAQDGFAVVQFGNAEVQRGLHKARHIHATKRRAATRPC